MKRDGIVIAIDGPAGVGKTTISRIIAERFGYVYINTGVMYRAVAWYAMQKGIELDREDEVTEIAMSINIRFVIEEDIQKIYVDDTDVTPILQGEEIGGGASIVSKIKGVRDVLSNIQRRMGEEGNVVMEGRDIGTVIFPDADIKFFLSASIEERAKRRYRELMNNGNGMSFNDILKDIKKRDDDDSKRIIAPLKKAEDAIDVDTTQLSIDEVVNFMIQRIDKKIME